MIRIRSIDGSVRTLDQTQRFVEICDLDGKVARLLYVDDTGAIHLCDANDDVAKNYARIFQVKFCPIVPLKPRE